MSFGKRQQDMVGFSFDWQLVLLPNGLRLITIARPGTPTVAVRAYVRAGSRYDVEHKLPDAPRPPLGLAHFTEHLLFKGTHIRSQREIFAAVERLGGVLDTETTKEYTTLRAVTPRQGLVTAIDILAEVLMEPALREEDFWKEKLIVLEEIRRAQDQHRLIFDLFAETLWQDHPLRFPILGTLEGLHDLDYELLLSFYRQRYVVGNMLLVVCGDIEHQEAQRLVAHRLASLPPGLEQPPAPMHEPPLNESRSAHLNKDVHQVHLLIGVPTLSMKHEDRSALKVVERVLGMGGSARLYQRLREETQLVYSVNTVTAHYEDAGYFAVYTSCDPQNVAQVEGAILEEWAKLRRQGVSDDELSAAKSNYAGTLARRFETNLALASIFGVEALLHRVETFEEAVGRINAVRPDDVMRVAQKYLNTECYVAVSVGRNNEA
ncbi:MAG: insulinase family protein [Chloroflexi bacterium]|nr:insulinase family protein [Chloroflexota bacterium]